MRYEDYSPQHCDGDRGMQGCSLAGMLVPAPCPWLARESIFEFTAREPKNRNPAEPGAPPEWRPRNANVVVRKLRMSRQR